VLNLPNRNINSFFHQIINTLSIPKGIAKSVGIPEGFYFLTVKDHMLTITPLPDPFWLASKFSKLAETTVEEIERMSEEGASSQYDLQFFLKYFLVASHVQIDLRNEQKAR
jgi:hypothetical protein